jgi:hypothetical protein
MTIKLKEKLHDIVKRYKKYNKEEYREAIKYIKKVRKNIKGFKDTGAKKFKKQVLSIPNKLFEQFVVLLTDKEFKSFSSTRGTNEFAKEFKEFSTK